MKMFLDFPSASLLTNKEYFSNAVSVLTNSYNLKTLFSAYRLKTYYSYIRSSQNKKIIEKSTEI